MVQVVMFRLMIYEAMIIPAGRSKFHVPIEEQIKLELKTR